MYVESTYWLFPVVRAFIISSYVASFFPKELARDRLLVELERERATAIEANSRAKESSLTAVAVGASLGAGLGIVLAVVMGAASALRKP